MPGDAGASAWPKLLTQNPRGAIGISGVFYCLKFRATSIGQKKATQSGGFLLSGSCLAGGAISSRAFTHCKEPCLKVNRLSRSNALLGSQPHPNGPSPIAQAYINGATIQSGAESLVLIEG